MKLPTTSRASFSNGGRRLNALIAAVVVIAVGVVGTVLLATKAAGVGTLTLTPATGNISLGSNVTVTITENSSTTAVNAIEADLTYDQTKLEFVSIDTSTSPFNGLVARATGGNGTVFLADGTTTPTTGSQIVGTVTFKAIGTGSTTIAFAASSGIAESTNNTDILGTTTGATYTIADTTAPSVPTGLAKTGATATSVSLSWTAATDNVAVTGYKIYRGGTQVGTSATTSFTNSGLSPSNTYSFTVAAVDAAGNTSAQSTALSAATTADTTAPSVPTGLASPSQTTTTISLAWTASTDNVGVTGYKVFRNGTQVGTTAVPSFSDTGLTSGTHYSYTVAAYDAAGNTSAQTGALLVKATLVLGDANIDGHVNYLDLSILSASWQSTTDLRADFNHDGVVNFLDLSIMASNWGI